MLTAYLTGSHRTVRKVTDFTSDSSFYGEHTFTARAKIVRHGEADGDWVSETA